MVGEGSDIKGSIIMPSCLTHSKGHWGIMLHIYLPESKVPNCVAELKKRTIPKFPSDAYNQLQLGNGEAWSQQEQSICGIPLCPGRLWERIRLLLQQY